MVERNLGVERCSPQKSSIRSSSLCWAAVVAGRIFRVNERRWRCPQNSFPPVSVRRLGICVLSTRATRRWTLAAITLTYPLSGKIFCLGALLFQPASTCLVKCLSCWMLVVICMMVHMERHIPPQNISGAFLTAKTGRCAGTFSLSPPDTYHEHPGDVSTGPQTTRALAHRRPSFSVDSPSTPKT